MNTNDTIVAPATAPGDGGIAIIRISGPQAYRELEEYFKPSGKVETFESHRLYHGHLIDGNGRLVDEVMAVYMAAPRTYTCDDVVEIHCHGSHQIVATILNLYLKHGLRLADPGEFTYRAYINGRLDLSQAEAVSRLISSKSDSSYRLALSQVDGLLSRKIHTLTSKLKFALVLSEAWIDFPEEDIPEEDIQQILSAVSQVSEQITPLLDTYNSGKILSEGAAILLVGQPNVGKSSLLNALLGEERAIVTAVPGTTRDLLEEGLTINGVPVRLIDTAGLHDSADLVEQEGIRRAESRLERADLVLLLVDGSTNINDLDFYVQNQCEGLPVFVVLTKDDLGRAVQSNPFPDYPSYRISSKTGYGLDGLRDAISSFLVGDYLPSSESVMLTEQRHYEALLVCGRCLERVESLLGAGESLEFLAFELREALHALGQISGETTTESVLDDIFSGFCIGK
jgi:tRNA modification GTPase